MRLGWDPTARPLIVFYELLRNKKQKRCTETVSFKIPLSQNIGKTELIIENARGSCGCTIADYPKKPIAPGASGKIDVSFNTENKKGPQSKTITIIANTQPNTKVLKIKAVIQVPEGESEN